MTFRPAARTNNWGITLTIVFILICISFAFSFLVIKDFSGPLAGITGLGPWPDINHDPVDTQEYTGFYFAKNLYFNPLPQLKLVNNQVFYPYGINNAFNPWKIEGDIFYATLYSFLGTGPWFQIYYLISVLITAGGAFALLLRDYGLFRAWGASLFVSFGNFYAINKYPHHLNQSIVHWTVLSLIADFLIVKRVVLKKHVSLKLILVRFCLLFLTFGQELGYVAGFSLTSFTVSILFIALLICYRYLRGGFSVVVELIRREIEAYKSDFFAYPRTCLALLAISLIAGYMYLPLTIQLARESRNFNFSGVDFGTFWIHPFRLLIPYFPGINTPERSFQSIFRDMPEAIGAGSPGWFLLAAGAIGLWQNSRQLAIFIPLLSMFLLCFLYIPQELFTFGTLKHLIVLILATLSLWFTRKRMRVFIPLLFVLLCVFFIKPFIFLLPTLKIFPWFTFNRVAGRSTLIYSTILSIFALHINLNSLNSSKKQLLTGLLVILACTELGTAYSFRLDYQQPKPLNQDFFAYMDYVRAQPGEAVLDWPFCIFSGGGADSICPFSDNGVFALRRFHEKKVMGLYLARLHDSQIEPLLQSGWDHLFLPDRTNSRQRRCFNQEEWSFFTDFYKFNDFAGINLYVDRLPEECLNEFYTRFGNPVAESLIPGVGRVKFIPKPSELISQVNLVSGTSLKFNPSDSLDLSDFSLLQVNEPHGLTITGLSEILSDEQGNYFRWGLDPESFLSFQLSEPQDLELTFNFDVPVGFPVDSFDVLVEINEIPMETFSNLGSSTRRNIRFQGVKGTNKVFFRYRKNKDENILNDAVKSIKSRGFSVFNMDYLRNKYRFWRGGLVVQFKELSISAASKSQTMNER